MTFWSEQTILLYFHLLYFAILAILLNSCLQQTHLTTANDYNHDEKYEDACQNVGNVVFCLVIVWHLVIWILGVWCYQRILSFYRFALPLSVLMVLPDWFLVQFAGTLQFPQNGLFWMIGSNAVSSFMVGLWSIPCLLILWACYPTSVENHQLSEWHYVKAAFTAWFIFSVAEQLLPFLWKPTDQVVHCIGGIAIYVMPAEIILGPAILYSYHVTKDSKNWRQPIMGAVMTMLIYTGALSIGLLTLEASPNMHK